MSYIKEELVLTEFLWFFFNVSEKVLKCIIFITYTLLICLENNKIVSNRNYKIRNVFNCSNKFEIS